ncbi:23S rRNA (adenine(1618)-N(6))-methyltransferase RlmF [Pedobacter sp. HMF7647]|uniref:Ribosomal RNA large subunit methyltransferase F n=1 Tax=Hufsiella arboris TaxID=2695275 RepID=A0A7K1Y4Q4_9SPHI|nr:23S rRNA (adenine(1618)-N(6))-methyltransferase RlmF [Hufsiella arboris]
MQQKAKAKTAEKEQLHPRNLHRGRYDFQQLCRSSQQLKQFVSINQFGGESIDFSEPDAVKALNAALLTTYYGVEYWTIPNGYLCPPIPGRADYLHYLADLLGETNKGIIPTGAEIKVLDIGTGANCIYPLIGSSVYGWSFVGSDVDAGAIRSARNIISKNHHLKNLIECRLQADRSHILKGIVKDKEIFDLVMCNPPFHASKKEAQAGTIKKWTNLGSGKTQKAVLNFGGTNSELWYAGGESAFIGKMIDESAGIKNQCLWFSSLVSKKETLPVIYKALENIKALDVRTINMSQGQKVSRAVAWTFLNETDQYEWKMRRF